MSELDPSQSRAIRDNLLHTIAELTELLRNNRTQLSDDEKAKINEAADELDNAVAKLIAQGIRGTALQIQPAVQGIQQATNNATNALKTLSNIKMGINIATALVGLGTAIAAGNPAGIVSAAEEVLRAVSQVKTS
jgi:hypothetical protein